MVFLPDNTITGLPTDDVMIGTPDSDEMYGFEGIDVIVAGDDIDLVYGNEDADLLYGSQADDTMYGGKGDDILFGGQGNDVLSGNKGNDTLYGDQGADTLTGGDGNDVIVIGRGTGGSNLLTADVMTDFDATVEQIILLDGLSYNDLTIESTETGDTVISDVVSGEVFIILEGVAPEALTPDRFIPETTHTVDPPPPPVPPLMSPEEAFENVELTPPVIEAELANDTGNSDTDGITSDPTITATVTDSSGVRLLEASFGGQNAEFVDISDALEADGTFILNLTQL